MNGYNRLAGAIGTSPGLGVFRRFLILNARDLLCRQAEIINLDHDLRNVIQADRLSNDPVRRQFEYDFSALKGPHSTPGGGVQWQRGLELRGLLREYSEALFRFAALCRLAPANKANLSSLQEFLEKPDGSYEYFLQSHEMDTWDDEYIQDMTSLAGNYEDKDALSAFVDKMISSVYHKRWGHKVHAPISLSVVEAWAGGSEPVRVVHYSEARITAAIDALSTILSSAIPAFCALGLFFIKNPLARMVTIVVCTILFSAVLNIIAKPKRAESFVATATFAAVLFVFVGSGNSPGC